VVSAAKAVSTVEIAAVIVCSSGSSSGAGAVKHNVLYHHSTAALLQLPPNRYARCKEQYAWLLADAMASSAVQWL
jgi:hypothetical protein